MATNPLYPGYKPKKPGEEPINNPAYPGYYTGQALPKKPQSKDFVKPIEYNFDVFMEKIDEVGEEVSNLPLAVPRWVKDRIVDDWKQQLKVSVSPTVNLDPTDLDDYATDDLVGATTKLSLNPKDWGIGHKDGIKQTGKQLLKTLKDWSKETTGIDYNNLLDSDFSDIENKARERLWSSALGYGDNTYNELEKLGGRALSDRTTAFFKDHRNKSRPLDLKGVSISDDNGVVERDIYRGVATAAAEFERGMDSPRDRDKNHTSFVSKGLSTANKEIMHHYLRGSDDVKNAIGKHAGAVEFFNIKAQTLETIEALQGSASATAKTLRKIGLGKSSTTALNALQELRDKHINGADGAVQKLTDLSNAARSLSSVGIPQKEIDKFIRETTKYSTRVASIQSVVEDSISRAQRGGLNILGLGDVAKKIEGKTPSKNFTSRTTFKGDIGDSLRRDMERSMMSNKDHDIGSLLNDRTVESDLSAHGVEIKAKNLTPLMYRLRQDRVRFATKEVLDAYDKGGVAQIIENYAWKKIKDVAPRWIERAVSGEIVGESLKKTNYFGLKVDEDYGVPEEGSLRMKLFDRKFGNTAKVKLDPGIRAAGLGGTIKVSGKEIEEGGFKKIYDHTSGNLRTLKILDFNDRNLTTAQENRVLFSKLLNNDRSDATLNQLSQKMFGVNYDVAMKSKSSRKTLNDLVGYEKNGVWEKGHFDKVGDWIGKKTGGKVKVLPKRADKYLELDRRTYGIDRLVVFPGRHLDLFKDNKFSSQIIQRATDKRGAFGNFKNLLLLDSELAPGVSRDDIVKNLYLASKGIAFNPADPDAIKFQELGLQMKAFSDWLQTQRGVLGDDVDNLDFRFRLYAKFKRRGLKEFEVNVDDTDDAFLFFTSVLKQNESMTHGYKLTDKKYMGRLERINKRMQELKKRWEKTLLARVIRVVSTWKDIIAEKVTALIFKLMSKLFKVTAASTGVFATVLPVAQAFVEKTIKKAFDYVTSTLKGILTLNFNDLDKLLEKDLKHLLIPCTCVLAGCSPILMGVGIVIFTILNVIPKQDASQHKTSTYRLVASNNTSGIHASLNTNVLPASTSDEEEDDDIVTGEVLLQCAGGGDSKCTGQWDGVRDFGTGLGGFYFNQWDPAWQSCCTMGNSGCFVTSLAMVGKYYGYDVTPPQVCETNAIDDFCTVGHYDTIGGAPGVSGRNEAANATDSVMMNWFEDNPEGIMILRVCIHTNDCSASSQHFVVITGYDADQNDFILYDPDRAPDLCLKKEYDPGVFPWTRVMGFTK